MILFGCCYLKFDLTIKFFFAIILVSALLIMTVTDIKEKVVDCNIAIGLAVIGILYNFIISPWQGLYSLIGVIVAVVVFEIIARIGIKPFGVRIIAEGDTYVAAAIGACFGIQNLGVILICTLLAAMIYSLPVYFIKQYKQKNLDICVLLSIFIISTICHYFLQNIIILVILAASGLILAFRIIKSIPTDENKLIMPFVPALALGTVFYLFFA
ncbi:MAG: prepilin peptidase [bacterium]|nr:prepilin peptidase [bacterium]